MVSLTSSNISKMQPHKELKVVEQELKVLLWMVKDKLLPEEDCKKLIKEKVINRIKMFKEKLQQSDLDPMQAITAGCGLALTEEYRGEFQSIFEMDYECEPGSAYVIIL